VIEVKKLSKSYGEVRALNEVSFNIDEGEIVGLLGPNGAGKTTIIKTLTGYLQPDSGSAHVNQQDVLTNPLLVQSNIGYLPENAPLYPELSVQSYLKMIADMRKIPEEKQVPWILEAVTSVGLNDYLTRPIGHLSKGFRQRVGLAQAILHKPTLLILDEPTVGLDPTQIIEIRKLITRLAEHCTVLFSTHILPEVEALCDRVIILMNGQVKADATLSDLATTSNAVLILEKMVSSAKKTLKDLDGVQEVIHLEEGRFPTFRIIGKDDIDITPRIFELAVQQNWPLRELRQDMRTLETIFNEIAIAA
jgi:ABC-2 type transport system ATP-binding protein